jgi:hypothetical protein
MVHFKSKEKSLLMKAFQLTQIGNSAGIISPKDILTTLGGNGGVPNISLKHLTALNQNPIAPKIAAKTNTSEKITQENRDALKKLAQ